MGNSPSYFDEDDLDKFDGIETLGYRVLGIQPNSPASKAGLVSFFDFLVGANKKMLLGTAEGLKEGDEYDDVDFPALLQEHVGKEVELLVWNIKAQQKRLVTLIPSNDWGGAGLLGVTIRIDDYGGADERLIRVLEIEKNSPAAIAGLVPLQDYLLGTTTESLENTNGLASVLEAYADRVVELYVYNTTSDVVRIVALMPTLSWGGKGLLGAEVGTGYLHRLPLECRGTTGNSVERKVVTRTRKPAAGPHRNGHPQEEEEELCMAPQLEMEPEPGQAHAMPMPELKATTPRETKVATVAAPEETVPPKGAEPEHAVEPKVPTPQQAAAAPEQTAPAVVPPPEQTVPPKESEPPVVPEPQIAPPPPPMAPPAIPPPPPVAPVPPPPPPPIEEPSSVATKYAAPTAASLFAGPPPPPAEPAGFASNAPYASTFMPPPPMSNLSKKQDEEVDLR